MAKFSFNGVDEISASFEQLARLSDEEKLSIILPSGRLLLQRQKEMIQRIFKKNTGDLENSLTLDERVGGDSVSVYISFSGKHRGSSTGKRHKKRPDGTIIPSGKYSGSNAEVAYILNFGSPRIKPTHWLDNANDEAEVEVAEAQQQAWDELVTKKGL